MNKSFTLLSVCFLFLAISLSSCKKDYTCLCTQPGNSIQEDYSFIINDTRNNAEYRCKSEEQNQEFGFGSSNCRLYN